MGRATRPKHPRKNTKSVFQNPVVLVTIITGIVGIITTFLTVYPNLRNSRAQEAPTPAATIAIQPSSTVAVPTLEPTQTVTPVSLAPSDTPTITLTPTPRPVSLTCLDDWWLVTGGTTYTEEARGGCARANIPELGFSTSADGFLVTWDRFRPVGVFGISVPIPENAVVRLHVKARDLYNAEFWIGLSNSVNPQPDVMILAVDPSAEQLTGSMRIYKNDFNSKLIGYLWTDLNPTAGHTNKPPFDYDIVFTITGGNVRIQVNNTVLTTQTVNFPRYLFLGARKKIATGSSAAVNITVSDLQIEADK